MNAYRITYTPTGDAPQHFDVWVDDDGTAWDTATPTVADEPSDWQRSAAGEWLWREEATPNGGNGTVTVWRHDAAIQKADGAAR